LLGGTVGIGTVLFALTIGPIVHWTLPVLSLAPVSGEVGWSGRGIRDPR
jgi:uncharacterized membrane protein YczE